MICTLENIITYINQHTNQFLHIKGGEWLQIMKNYIILKLII